MTASPTQCPEAFHERLDKLQEDFPSVTILVITPETHNTFLDGDLRAESWDDPRHLVFRDRLKEWLESTYDSPWDYLNNLCEKIAERIKEDEE